MPKLGDGMPYLGGYGLIATARVGRPSFPGILFAFLCESAIPTPVEQEQGIVYHNRTRQGGDVRLLSEFAAWFTIHGDLLPHQGMCLDDRAILRKNGVTDKKINSIEK